MQQEALGRSTRPVCLVSLKGTVDAVRLRSALADVVSRHEILRTVFRRQAGMKMPFQVVQDAISVDWQQVDLSAFSDTEQRQRIGGVLEAEQWREFDPASAPVLRGLFFECGNDRSALILSVPSLCVDAPSFRMLVDEMAALYGRNKQELEDAFRYLQFSQWQSDLLESVDDDAKQSRDFWNKQFANPLPAPALPFERKTSAPFDPGKISVPLTVAPQLVDGGSNSDILLAAWQSLLYRLSGQNAFTTGFYSQNREYDELKNAIGCFGRTLPIAVQIESTFTFSDVLRRAGGSERVATAVQE